MRLVSKLVIASFEGAGREWDLKHSFILRDDMVVLNTCGGTQHLKLLLVSILIEKLNVTITGYEGIEAE